GPRDRARPGVPDEAREEAVGGVDPPQRLVQIDDVDAVALAEDEATHLRVPTARLVAEMDAGLQQLLHGDDSHGVSPSVVTSARRARPEDERPWGAGVRILGTGRDPKPSAGQCTGGPVT